jgi:predicted SnoaL-like aldol condensation-catalyzing enzyme
MKQRTPTVESPDASGQASRALVLAFYERALIAKRPREAFEQFASADFIEHKDDVAGGSGAAVAAFLEGLMAQLPSARWEVLRTIAERDFVFLHARFVPAPGAQPYFIGDVFRLQDGKIAEHWDIVQSPREHSRGSPA